VFAGNLSVLVNGSPTNEINIQRGLKQGDPLAPFLFLLVAEGLAGLMRSAVEKNLFKGFAVGSEGLEISHLQYADDTLCIGEASMENLWTLKAILRGFELTSGLKVNFGKSCLIGVNVPNGFMVSACDFLNCKRGEVPVWYLGLPVGANPRRASTWEPMVECLRKRLKGWRNRYVSLGGRIVLINSVLNSIPIFYLSFIKVPVLVLKKIIRIQREFLWGGTKGGRRINWVKWKEVCKPKGQGGLGVRDVGKVNLSLLVKWRWKLLQYDDAVWKKVLVARYGEVVRSKVHWIDYPIPNRASVWWKDLCRLDILEEESWFARNVVRKVGRGDGTRFWEDWWVGAAPLSIRFPRLYSISLQKEAFISEIRVNNDEGVHWEWHWRRELFAWELELLEEVKIVVPMVAYSGEDDVWSWEPGEGGVFTVNSVYKLLCGIFSEESIFGPNELRVLKNIWRSSAPSKVIAFAWKVLRNRIPTKGNLALRGVQVDGGVVDCGHCVGMEEVVSHLFLTCDFAYQVWTKICRWLGILIVLPNNLFTLFEYFVGVARNKKMAKGFAIIWQTTIWSIWRSRNDIAFSNGVRDLVKVVEDIKQLSWRWGLARRAFPVCLFYEWCCEPGICLS
jgi:hypothetical protein